MSDYCPDCGNTMCLCDEETRLTYPLRVRILELEIDLSKSKTSLSKANHQLKKNKMEYNLKVTSSIEKISKLERELEQQKFNNKHNLSIDEQVAKKLAETERILVKKDEEILCCAENWSDDQKKLKVAINALKAIDNSNDDMKYFNIDIHNIIKNALEAISSVSEKDKNEQVV